MELKNLSKFLPLSLVVVAILVALSCGAPEDSEDEAASTSGEKSGKPGETTKTGPRAHPARQEAQARPVQPRPIPLLRPH